MQASCSVISLQAIFTLEFRMSRYPPPELSDLPEDIQKKILEVQEKAGFVPNVFLTLARRPAEWRAFFAYHDALMLKEESGNPTGSAHGAILRIYEKKTLLADQVAVNYRKADISPRQKAMLDFAMRVSERSHEIADADIEGLSAHGFNAEDAWDIAAITAFFGLSNRMASFTNMQPNPEFYLLGRVPKTK
jgi:alkylhydroperoxidase family enzyme